MASILPTACFVLSAAVYTHKSKQKPPISDSKDTPKISRRGLRTTAPPLPYLSDFFTCLANPFHAVTNPHGYIALCIAENKLIVEALSKRLTKSDVALAAFGEEDYFCYNDFLGIPDVRSTVARFLTRKFWRPTSIDVCMDPQHVILSSGCAASLNNLFYTLAEEKEAVLIPAPYYCAFESDMKVFAQCVPIPVPSTNSVQGPTVEELEAAAQLAESVGDRLD